MARPRSETVEYFPHDTDASSKKTLTIIEGQFGNDGYTFWFKLLEWLGRSSRHYYDARQPQDLEFLCRKCGVDGISGTGILDKLAALEAIDPILWFHKVIWSQNFVTRVSDVYKKRGTPAPEKPCFCDGNCHHDTHTGGIPEPETRIPDTEMQQSKLNNSTLLRKGGEPPAMIKVPLDAVEKMDDKRGVVDLTEAQYFSNGHKNLPLTQLKEQLRKATNKVGYLGEVFQDYHPSASDEEKKACFGRFAAMVKRFNGDYELILATVIRTQDGLGPMKGSHLDWIEANVKTDSMRSSGNKNAAQSGRVQEYQKLN